jgi:hypothetical protein
VQSESSRSWVLRATVGEKRHDIGLGGFPAVPLVKARERARDARDSIRKGIDPVQEALDSRNQLKASQATALTFRDAALRYVADHRAG